MGNTESSNWLEGHKLETNSSVVHEDWNLSVSEFRGNRVSIFLAAHPSSSRKRPYIENALQSSKIYRHPGILRYVDGGISGNDVYIVTEEATPLLSVDVSSLSLLQITAGLSSITEALVFLHDKAGVSHNNVCASNIYVTSDGVWKLWGLEYTCSFGDLSRGHIERIDPYCCEKNLPPDRQSRTSPAYQHARDCYFYAKFITDHILPHMDSCDALIAEFESFLKSRALAEDWNQRPRLVLFNELGLFQSDFLKLRTDLARILVQPADRRDQFIKLLPDKLLEYPEELVASTLSSLLLSHTVFLIPSCSLVLLPRLLRPRISGISEGRVFSEVIFQEFILPRILSLFAIRDASIRSVLMDSFSHYVHLIPKDTLTEFLLPELLLGVKDKEEALVSATLRCLADLVPILGADLVVGQNREQLFSNSKPKVKFAAPISKSLVKKSSHAKPFAKFLSSTETPLPSTDESSDKSIFSEIIASDSTVIPERSSPDGGETLDLAPLRTQESPNTRLTASDRPSEENWSDWDDMQDQSPLDIRGVLHVHVSDEEDPVEHQNTSSLSNTLLDATVTSNDPPGLDKDYFRTDGGEKSSARMNIVKGSADENVSASKTRAIGDEFDIMSIKIAKKPDRELEMFADLMPKLQTNNYSLEKMLMEASRKSKNVQKGSQSLSSTLFQLEIDSATVGDEWNDEEKWGFE